MEKEGEIRQKMCILIMNMAGEIIEHKQRWNKARERHRSPPRARAWLSAAQQNAAELGTGAGMCGCHRESSGAFIPTFISGNSTSMLLFHKGRNRDAGFLLPPQTSPATAIIAELKVLKPGINHDTSDTCN